MGSQAAWAHTCLCRNNSTRSTQEDKPPQQGLRGQVSLLAGGAFQNLDRVWPAERPCGQDRWPPSVVLVSLLPPATPHSPCFHHHNQRARGGFKASGKMRKRVQSYLHSLQSNHFKVTSYLGKKEAPTTGRTLVKKNRASPRSGPTTCRLSFWHLIGRLATGWEDGLFPPTTCAWKHCLSSFKSLW